MLPDDHPYLGYGIDSRPQCCECKFVDTNKAKFGSLERDREDTQLGDIRKWAGAYDRDSFLLPKQQKDAGGIENPCDDQLSLACLRHNDNIKTAKLDDMERWGEFGGQKVWRAPILNISKRNAIDNMANETISVATKLDPDPNKGPHGTHGLNKPNATATLNSIRNEMANINAPSVNAPDYDNNEEMGK